MSEHYTKNTIRTLRFCETCGKKTMHRVDDGRIGLCVEPHVKGLSKKQARRKEEHTADLF